MRIVVVLPAPLGPRKPVTEPGSTVKLRSETARTGPKALVRPRTSTRTGAAAVALPVEIALSSPRPPRAGGRPDRSIQAHRTGFPARSGERRADAERRRPPRPTG